MCSGLPLYNQGLGWVVPAFMGMFLGVVIKVSREKLMSKEVEIKLK
ncbi:hypothetical protein GCM10008906_04720 [Clostridium oceanicum]|uniref:Branched-chain amino acid transport system carrier protein n=1 Tax=Clostridium oceanicum TaxID=1543 RepID=A0ABN1JA77_9CLOT